MTDIRRWLALRRFRVKLDILRRKQEAVANFMHDLNLKSEKSFQIISKTGKESFFIIRFVSMWLNFISYFFMFRLSWRSISEKA